MITFNNGWLTLYSITQTLGIFRHYNNSNKFSDELFSSAFPFDAILKISGKLIWRMVGIQNGYQQLILFWLADETNTIPP